MKQGKFYITTSIAYTNSPPHIGFALELVQADVLARYKRLLGKEVFFLTGTDEHGAKVAKAAKAAGEEPKIFTDKIAGRFLELAKVLDISNDYFIRTTDKRRHWPSVEKVWQGLKESGDIYKKEYRGLYCSGCEAFITKKDLADGKCIIHQREPEKVEEENYFFRLSKYSKEIKEAIEIGEIKILPQGRKNEILSFISQGLQDVSFSRPRNDLKWAIPVPGDASSSIYVWADALTNYISALGYDKESSKFKKFWPADVHFIGKDILRFHAVIWPGMLLSLGLPLPKTIFVHGHITKDGQKISKSLGNAVDPFELVEKYGADTLRYYLLREILPTEDGDFTRQKFEERYNGDLAKGLGNLVARVMAVAISSKFPVFAESDSDVSSKKTPKFINKTWKAYRKAVEEFKFNDALAAIWDLVHFSDKYIEEIRPWENSGKKQPAIYNLLFSIANIASLLEPFLPKTSEDIFSQLGIKPTSKKWLFKVKKGKPLFPRF
ncbi:MAG: methionine--tRNA ligase [Candidatus Nealsonbacteria bacterium]|nr:methionine--tRNA ligase [Candidatus Nealsonbacteria bacterium]